MFGLPFLLGGLAVAWFLYVPALSGWWAARGWEEVPCWIEKAEMKTSRGSKGDVTYHTTAAYRYQYRGRTYHSEAVDFMSGSDNIGDFQQRVYEQLQPLAGQERPFRCYVNPAAPEHAVLYRDLRWGLLLLLSIFPMIFPLVGGLVSIGGWMQSRKVKQMRELAVQHPHEPWRWRKEWAGDAITASRDGLIPILIGAIWVLLIQAPLTLAIVMSGELAKSFLPALALLPSLLALMPLWLVWNRTRTLLAIGRPTLQLKQQPVVPGRVMEGELRFTRMLSPLTTIHAQVLCQRRIVRSTGKGTSTSTEKIWEHTETLSANEARRDIGGVVLPLRVEIPRGLPCAAAENTTQVSGMGEHHEWRLELAPASGGKAAVLPLPVFRTGREEESSEPDTSGEVEAIAPDTAQLVKALEHRGVTALFDDSGIPTLFDCQPKRLRGMAIFMLLFGSVWFAIFLVMVYQGAPAIFRLTWGITSPLILGTGLWMLLHRYRVEITPDEMSIQHVVGPFYSWKETYAPRHIIGFKHDSNMQSGSQFYYRVRAETTFGKMKTLVDGITESITAETLAKRLEDWRKSRSR